MINNKYFLLFVIVMAVIFVDQWSKQLAVYYLRSPDNLDSRREHFQECAKALETCERRCGRVIASGTGSFSACKRTCELQESTCKARLEPSYLRIKKTWKSKVEALKSSFMCRRINPPDGNSSRLDCVVLKDYFHFTYRTNPGAAWGIFSTIDKRIRRPFFICITLIAILFIFYLFAFRLEPEHRLMIIALALILGGALGNFIDRLRLDYVIDFIEWFWRDKNRYVWPTFNIADAAITIGVGLIGIELLVFAPPEDLYDDDEEVTPSAEGVTVASQAEGGEATEAKASPEDAASSNEAKAPKEGGSSAEVSEEPAVKEGASEEPVAKEGVPQEPVAETEASDAPVAKEETSEEAKAPAREEASEGKVPAKEEGQAVVASAQGQVADSVAESKSDAGPAEGQDDPSKDT